MTEEQHPSLEGVADPNSWHFARPHGPLPNPVGHTFPLLAHDEQGLWRLIGTGFYISGDGLFVTAAHVVKDVLDRERQVAPLVIMHLSSESGVFGPQGYVLRPIVQCWIGESSDIALGVAAHATNKQTGEVLTHWSWPLNWTVPAPSDTASTYAFPSHSISLDANGQKFRFQPALYPGKVIEVGDSRDRLLVPYPYMQVDFRIHGAASGGPVIKGDAVVGVNCRYLEPDGPGTVAQIRNLQDAFVDHAVLQGESTERTVTFTELVSKRAVMARNYKPDTLRTQTGRLVRLDQLMVTAPGPALEVAMTS